MESGRAGYAHPHNTIVAKVQRAYTAHISNGKTGTDILGEELVSIMVVQEISFVRAFGPQET